MRLAGEIALVTGSTSGIGRAIAARFAAEGARVVVTGRAADRGAATVADIRAAGGEARFVAADLAQADAATTLVATAAEAYGGLSVLVANHVGRDGITDAPLAELDLASWETALAVNLTSVAWLCRAAIPHLTAAGHGSIVLMSSRAADRGTPGLAAYTATKGAVDALCRSIAVDYADQHVRCNVIAPGYVDHEDRPLDDAARARYEGMHLTRLGLPADVAQAAVWLASRESEFVTGITLPVDGGSSAARGLVLG